MQSVQITLGGVVLSLAVQCHVTLVNELIGCAQLVNKSHKHGCV